MSDALEQEALDLVNRLNRSLESCTTSLAGMNSALGSFETEIMNGIETLDGYAEKAEEAAEKVRDVLSGKVLEELSATVDGTVEALSRITDLRDKIALDLAGDDGILTTCDTAVQTIADLTSNAEDYAEDVGDAIDTMQEAFDTRTDEILESLYDAMASLDTMIESEIESITETVSDNIVEPLLQASEALQTNWSRIFNEQVTEVLDELFESVNDQIQAPLQKTVADMAGLLEDELERLIQELTSGDAEGEGVRASLESSLEMLEGVMEPMEAAFDVFRSLASSVGVDL